MDWDRDLSTSRNLLPLDHELYALTEVGARHWLAMDGWTLDEAALLLSGANPKKVEMFALDPNVSKPDYTSCGYVGTRDRLSRAAEMGVLKFPCAPGSVCKWASAKHSIPGPLAPAMDDPCLGQPPAEAQDQTDPMQQLKEADRDRKLKRKALVAEYLRQWPTIDRDLKDAATNGLRKAAGVGEHGYYWEGAALDWARSRGKLKSVAPHRASVFDFRQ